MNDFPAGIFYNERRDTAPDFITGGIGFQVKEAVKWLQENADHDGRVKLDIKISKGGKTYLAKNDWVPGGSPNPQAPESRPEPQDEFDSDLPF